MKKIYIKTFGCKTNQVESAIMEEKLLKSGYEKSNDKYDIVIVNSCTVTDVADSKCLQFLRSQKHERPDIKTVIVGCIPQYQKEKLLKYDFIDIILGNEEKLHIDKYINEDNFYKVEDISAITEFQNYDIEKLSRTRANLKIQDGCNNKCSYCAINIARGKSRSNSLHNILKQIEKLTKNGYKEIILTGIHLNLWGKDLTPSQNIIDLLEAIEKTDIKRYRIGSLYPDEVTDELLNLLQKSEKFCPHFHLSLQSMNTKILKLMNRTYTQELCVEKIKKIKQMFPTSFVGADIIVGFPTESEEDFCVTYENIKNSDFSSLHIFPYSKRENTVAANMPEQVEEKVKKERAKRLKLLAEGKFQNFLNKNLNKTLRVLVEKNIKNTAVGLSENYINIEIPESTIKRNSIVTVKTKSVNKNKIIAEVL